MRAIVRLPRWRRSLHAKLMVSLVMLVTIVAGGSAYALLERGRTQRLAELEERANRIADLFGQSLAQPLWNVDRDAIERQLKALAPNPEVVRITVTAAGYGVIADIRNARQPAAADTVVRVRPIDYKPQGDAPRERIGEVQVVLTKAVAQRSFAAARVALLATLALVLAVLYVATFLMIRHLVRGPIGRLEHMVDLIAGGDLDARCKVESDDEIGRLAQRVNVMAARLRDSTASLRESERKYRGIIENSLAGIFVLDRRGGLREANPAMAQLLGFPDVVSLMASGAHVALGSDAPCIPFTDEQTARLFAQLRDAGEIAGLELELTRADGSAIWCLMNARGTWNGEGDPASGMTHLEGQITDVTERKQAMESLTRHRDALEQEVQERERTEHALRDSREKLRLLSAHLESIREEERKQIAMTIHDELGQLLTAIKMDVSLLRMLLNQGTEWGGKLGEMGELVERTIGIVRDVASHLRPAALNFGLVSALEWLVQDFSRHSHVACRFQCDGQEPVMSDDRATAVFRILQEALTNVSRHAQATQVIVSLRGGEDGFEVTVSDDGIGFDIARAAKGGSYGLQGMRERARMIGAVLHASSEEGVGSTIHLSVECSRSDIV
jgi:PAS domain S-box-containing protein